MSDSPNLSLPLLMPSQAQKHVTVNEALLRLDSAVNLVLRSLDLVTPPEAAPDGVAFGVPDGAVNAWADAGGKIALGQGGGWVFMQPARGWRAFVEDRGAEAIHDGTAWQVGAATLTPKGAGIRMMSDELSHSIVAGNTNTVGWTPSGPVMMLGVTARVTEALSGGLTSWSLGWASAPGQFGSGLGTGQGSWCRGLMGTPTTIWSPEPLTLTAHGGAFEAGAIRIAIHYIDLMLPTG